MDDKVDKRKFNKGHKGVSGRKTKKQEKQLIEKLSKYDVKAQNALFRLIDKDDMRAITLFYAYRYGKPIETKDVKITQEQPLFEINYDTIVEDIVEDNNGGDN
jgi:hypothetical protein